jgi:predicted MPP superfamily phosphohydrolase
MILSDCAPDEQRDLSRLGERIGATYVRQRLGLEGERQNAPRLQHRLIRAGLTLGGLRKRGRRNVLNIQLRHNTVLLARLPREFDGTTLLHISDPHLDMDAAFLDHLIDSVQGLAFDACVITGDFRFHSFGPYQAVLDALARLRPHLGSQVQAVLGNHDSIRMVPGMEARGYPVLMNESVRLQRGAASLALVGIDDAHYFRTHNLHKAMADVAQDDCVVLLSHTPEPYRQAAHAGVHLMLSGHTHGGQVCLPGGIPILTDTPTPRAYVRGAWSYREMAGYTSVGCGSSVVDVRLNCLPELTLHTLRCT